MHYSEHCHQYVPVRILYHDYLLFYCSILVQFSKLQKFFNRITENHDIKLKLVHTDDNVLNNAFETKVNDI